MNKKLMAVAVAGALAIPGMALAQSSVTLYGTIDTGIRNVSKVDDPAGAPGATGSVMEVSNNLHTTNRWGMTGSEDLGGGMKANFKLEGQYTSDTGDGTSAGGGLNFQRSAWVGLSSGGASFALGRDYTVNFKELGKYDPMSYTYTGIMPAVKYTAGVRSSNMITGAFGGSGFEVRADYALGEQVGSTSAGTRFGIGANYSTGPITVAGAYSTTKNAANTGSTKDTTIGGAYRMNAFTFRAGWAQTAYDAQVNANLDKARMIMLGVQYDFSSRVSGRIGYYDIKNTGRGATPDDGKKKDAILAVDYSLSKRTTAYAAVDNHSLDGVYDAGTGYSIGSHNVHDGSTGVGVGIVHKF